MTTKHTKGEWYYQEIDNYPQFRVSFSPSIPICTVHYYSPKMEKEEAEANAKLMAAAPDLLEALETYTLRMETMNNEIHLKKHGTYQKALKAINKATK